MREVQNTEDLLVCLLCTEREYKAGLVERCLDRYFGKDVSTDRKVDVFVFFNKGELSNYDSLRRFEEFNSIGRLTLFSHELDDEDDIYLRSSREVLEWKKDPKGILTRPRNRSLPSLGASAGPNNLFYRSFETLLKQTHRYFLLIECDTFPVQPKWFDKISDYCCTQDFMIAGSLYLGCHKFPEFDYWTGHLNGVAMYRNCDALERFLNKSEQLIQAVVQRGAYSCLNYDVALHLLSGTLYGKMNHADPRKPETHLISTPLIANYAMSEDQDVSVNEVQSRHPEAVILHKK